MDPVMQSVVAKWFIAVVAVAFVSLMKDMVHDARARNATNPFQG